MVTQHRELSQHSFNTFSGVVATLVRSVKTCVLRLSPDKVCFVISEGRGPVGGANIWCELSQVRRLSD